MEPGTIEQVVAAIGQQVAAATGTLVPVGQDVTGWFIVLSILLLGANMIASGSPVITSSIIRMAAAAAGTYYAIGFWPEITMGALQSARAAIGLMVQGGYGGPTTLFHMANDISGRLEFQGVAFQWSSPMASVLAGVTSAFIPILVWVGLSLTGLLAALAEFELVIGSAVAPLVLPALAFGFTMPLGWGAIRFLVSAAVRVVVMGATAHIMADTVSGIMTVGGTEAALSHEQVYTLFGVSLVCGLIGLCMNGIANNLVGGGAGVLGLGSVMRGGNMAASAGNAAARAGAAAAQTGAAAVRIAAGPAGAAVGGASRAASAAVKAVRSGSAFK